MNLSLSGRWAIIKQLKQVAFQTLMKDPGKNSLQRECDAGCPRPWFCWAGSGTYGFLMVVRNCEITGETQRETAVSSHSKVFYFSLVGHLFQHEMVTFQCGIYWHNWSCHEGPHRLMPEDSSWSPAGTFQRQLSCCLLWRDTGYWPEASVASQSG